MATQNVATVSAAPPKPLLVYDGDCNFCMRWVRRWQRNTGDTVAYTPFQEAAAGFPDIPRESFEREVKFITPQGLAFGGAAAVFRLLNAGPRRSLLARLAQWSYEHAPGFAAMTEFGYRVVARHRSFFSALTSWM